jgi:hypothetical protein
MRTTRHKSPSVAIIGTEGAGKTVLTAVLAKRLGDPAGGMFLNAKGPKTLKHVEKVWSTLQGGDWPEGNPAGELFELRWKLEIEGNYVCDVRFIESAGQDIRLLFEGEQFEDAPTPELKGLAEYCGQADIIIFLINLGDFIGNKQSLAKASNEAAIKAAMDTLSECKEPKRFCIVITQADLFHGELERLGNWSSVLKVHLGNLHGAYVHSGKAKVFPVSAVSDTAVRDHGDGRMVRVPKQDFGSNGLDELIGWLRTNTQDAAKEFRERPVFSQPAIYQSDTELQPPGAFAPAGPKSRVASSIAPIVTSAICLFLLPHFCKRTVPVTVPGVPTLLERMLGITPAATTYTYETVNWIIIIVIAIILSIIALFIVRSIEDDS